jgi:hypothetical protein
MSGTISGVSNPPGCRVVVLTDAGGVFVASTISHATTGAFSFTSIPNGNYAVVFLDVQGTLRGRIAHTNVNVITPVTSVSHLPLSADLTDTRGLVWQAMNGAAVSGGKLVLSGANWIKTTGNVTAFDIGQGERETAVEFCVEAFVTVSVRAEAPVFAKWGNGGTSYFFGFNEVGKPVMYYTRAINNLGQYIIGTAVAPLGSEFHVAFYSKGEYFYVAINGVPEPMGYSFGFLTTNQPNTIGAINGGGSYFKGAIRDVRVHNDKSIYGSTNFTPPSPPLGD